MKTLATLLMIISGLLILSVDEMEPEAAPLLIAIPIFIIGFIIHQKLKEE